MVNQSLAEPLGGVYIVLRDELYDFTQVAEGSVSNQDLVIHPEIMSDDGFERLDTARVGIL